MNDSETIKENENILRMSISCPHCGAETEVEMKLRQNQIETELICDELAKVFMEMFDSEKSEEKEYSFGGTKTCKCGKQIVASFFVSAISDGIGDGNE